MKRKSSRAFTLIELLVVVAIIGVLASVVLASLNGARAKGADARRKADLAQIRTALELYYSTCGTYIVAVGCTGTAYGSGGNGWFGANYGTGSVAQGLVNNSVIGGLVMDPSGVTTTNAVDRSGYMIYVDQNYYTLWANLQNPTAADTATQNSCYFSGYDSYSGTYPIAARMNYCISN